MDIYIYILCICVFVCKYYMHMHMCSYARRDFRSTYTVDIDVDTCLTNDGLSLSGPNRKHLPALHPASLPPAQSRHAKRLQRANFNIVRSQPRNFQVKPAIRGQAKNEAL